MIRNRGGIIIFNLISEIIEKSLKLDNVPKNNVKQTKIKG